MGHMITVPIMEQKKAEEVFRIKAEHVLEMKPEVRAVYERRMSTIL